MSKTFFEVFPSIKVNKELHSLLEEVIVSRVTCNQERTKIRVYLDSERWIHKKHIYDLEKKIARQCFEGLSVDVKVIERLHLSSQYTAENFFDIYKESMELELENVSMVESSLFAGARPVFTDRDSLELEIPDTFLAREKSHFLEEYLHKVFCERCGLDLKLSIRLTEPKESRQRRNDEKMIEEEVASISRNIHPEKEPAEEASKPEKPESPEKSAANTPKAADTKKEAAPESRPVSARKELPPDVIYGKDFDGDLTELSAITDVMGEVMVRGQVMEVDTRSIKNEKTILIFSITDFTDSIVVKVFLPNEHLDEVLEGVKKKAFLKIWGRTMIDRFDGELTIGNILGMKKIKDFTHARMDHSPQKRVELHCHTKMSDMDGVTEAKALVKRAYEWGHKAIAITDHGVVQAFPEANHCFDAWGGCVPKDSDFKVLYGMEAYLVDDLKGMVTNSKGQDFDSPYVVFDIETRALLTRWSRTLRP